MEYVPLLIDEIHTVSTSVEIRITEHTELGSNETVKIPPPLESSRSARKRDK
jgi:hypothetical protein